MIKSIEEKKKNVFDQKQEYRQNIKETKLMGSVIPHRNHRVFGWDVITNKIELVTPTESIVVIDGASVTKKRVDMQPNCRYVSAMNMANAIKKFERTYGVRIVHKKREKAKGNYLDLSHEKISQHIITRDNPRIVIQ